MMKHRPITLVLLAALSVYPIAIYIADDHLSPSQLLSGLLLLVSVRLLVLSWYKPQQRARYAVTACVILAAAIAILLLFPHIELIYVRFYPALFASIAFAIFFGSLFTKMPLVERFARMQYSSLPPQAIIYTQRVTLVWCGVLFCNVLVSLYTTFGTTLKIWSLYNGLLIYFVFGGVYLCEYLIRLYMFRKWAAT